MRTRGKRHEVNGVRDKQGGRRKKKEGRKEGRERKGIKLTTRRAFAFQRKL
jgi:hypothetical protein